MKGSPEIAKFQFRASNRWISGTHNESTIHGFYGAGQELTHRSPRPSRPTTPRCSSARTTHPLRSSSCSTRWPPASPSGIANIAAARGVNLTSVESTVEGDIDLLGILGLSDEVRNGYEQIRISFHLEGDDPDKLRRVVEQSRLRSAVYDVLTNGVPVRHRGDHGLIDVNTTSTSWSSGDASPVPRQPCCWRGPAYGSRWSTAGRTAATRSRRTG